MTFPASHTIYRYFWKLHEKQYSAALCINHNWLTSTQAGKEEAENTLQYEILTTEI